jgi:hypothetical protein
MEIWEERVLGYFSQVSHTLPQSLLGRREGCNAWKPLILLRRGVGERVFYFSRINRLLLPFTLQSLYFMLMKLFYYLLEI